jgi:hypothetical protein
MFFLRTDAGTQLLPRIKQQLSRLGKANINKRCECAVFFCFNAIVIYMLADVGYTLLRMMTTASVEQREEYECSLSNSCGKNQYMLSVAHDIGSLSEALRLTVGLYAPVEQPA